jgi:uncharacterized membrane protein HdeD (DUF308 family)
MEANPALMQSWWVLGLRGLIAVLFGVFALLMPTITLLGLIGLFSIYAVLAGLVAIAGALRHVGHARGAHAADWWLLLAIGIVSVVAGIVATMRPLLTMLLLVMVIGINAVLTGVLDLVAIARARRYAPPEGTGLWALGALVSIIFGAVIMSAPEVGALTLVWIVGIYALVAGALYLGQAWRAAQVQRVPGPAPGGRPERRVRDRRMAPSHT